MNNDKDNKTKKIASVEPSASAEGAVVVQPIDDKPVRPMIDTVSIPSDDTWEATTVEAETPDTKAADATNDAKKQRRRKPAADDDSREADDERDAIDTAFKEAIAEQAREDERPQSSSFTLRKILGGDILTAQMIHDNIWLFVLIVFFVIIYISNRYSVQKDLLELDRLNTELEDAKYRALSSSSNLTEKSRESHVLEMLKNSPDSALRQPDKPPYIIQVPDK